MLLLKSQLTVPFHAVQVLELISSRYSTFGYAQQMKSYLRRTRTWRKWSGHHSLRGRCFESRIASRLDVATKEAAGVVAVDATQ